MRALLIIMTTFLFVATATAQYSGGTGEPDDPYLIYTAEQMNRIGAEPNDWDKHFELMADIDLGGYSGTDYNVIAPYDEQVPFTGTFEGNGHTISNFIYTASDANSIALFGWVVGEDTRIANVGLIDPNLEASTRDGVAPLVDCSIGGTISRCFVRGGRVSGNRWVAGLVGSNGGLVTHCYSTTRVSGSEEVGGLVGHNGLWRTVLQCYSSGPVSGRELVGGLVGTNWGTVIQCYSSGAVDSNCLAGGLVGTDCAETCLAKPGDAFDCFWDTQTSGQNRSADGTGLTTAQMQDIQTYRDAGWDLVGSIEDGASEVWQMPEGGGYPVLAIFSGHVPPELQGRGTPDSPYLIASPSAGMSHRNCKVGARLIAPT